MEILSSRGALNKRVKNAKTISIVVLIKWHNKKQLAKTSERCKELNRKLLSFFSELFKCKRVANLLKKDTIKQEITVALVCILREFQCLTLFQLMRSPVEQLSSPKCCHSMASFYALRKGSTNRN